MNLVKFIQHFNSVKCTSNNKYMAKCPCHDDKNASLSISEENGKILLHCFAGCDTQSIVNSIGLTLKDLFIEKKEKKTSILEKEYYYTDENGNKLYKCMRYNPKRFVQAKA